MALVFALMSAATGPRRRRTLLQHISIRTAHTHARSALASTCSGSRSRCSFVFVAPLSRRCRCGRHAQVAGCGTGSRHRLCLGRTHTSVRASGAASRRPARAIAGGGEGGGARPRAADEQLVGGGEGVCALPRRKEGVRGMRGDARAASRGCTGAIAVQNQHAGERARDCRFGGQGAGSSARKTCRACP